MDAGSSNPNRSSFVPVVRYMIVSNDLRIDPTRPQLVDVVGLLYSIRAHGTPPFQIAHDCPVTMISSTPTSVLPVSTTTILPATAMPISSDNR